MKKMIRYTFPVVLFVLLSLNGFSQNAYITNENSRYVSVINTATNQTLDSIPVATGSKGIVVSNDGNRVYVSYEFDGNNTNSISVLDPNTHSHLTDVFLNETPAQTSAIDISADDRFLYVPVKDSLLIINTQTLSVDARIPLQGFGFNVAVATSADGAQVYAGGLGYIYYINPNTNMVSDSVFIPGSHFYQFTTSPDSKTLYALDNYAGELYIIDVTSKTYSGVRVAPLGQLGIATSPDGENIYIASTFVDSVVVVNAASKTITASVHVGISPVGINVSRDGRFLYVVINDEDKVSVLDASTLAIITDIPVGKQPWSVGKFISRADILPVKLLAFTAIPTNSGDISLQWKTGAETNSAFFTIQRSTDGLRFTPIGKLNATNNATGYQYTFTDNTAQSLSAQTIYYRLTITDAGGAVAAGNIISVSPGAKKIAMQLLPNPVQDHLGVRVHNYSGDASIFIVDVAGKTLMHQKVTLSAGITVSLNTSALAKGVYYLRLKVNNLLLQQKFVKE